MIKRLITICSVLILFTLAVPDAYAQQPIGISIDNRTVRWSETQPFLQNGRIMAPVRVVFETLSARVGWDENAGTATVLYGQTSLLLQAGNSNITINNREYKLDRAPLTIDGRMFIPLREVFEKLNCQVFWDEQASAVFIATPAEREKIDKIFSEAIGKLYCSKNLSVQRTYRYEYKAAYLEPGVDPYCSVTERTNADINLENPVSYAEQVRLIGDSKPIKHEGEENISYSMQFEDECNFAYNNKLIEFDAFSVIQDNDMHNLGREDRFWSLTADNDSWSNKNVYYNVSDEFYNGKIFTRFYEDGFENIPNIDYKSLYCDYKLSTDDVGVFTCKWDPFSTLGLNYFGSKVNADRYIEPGSTGEIKFWIDLNNKQLLKYQIIRVINLSHQRESIDFDEVVVKGRNSEAPVEVNRAFYDYLNNDNAGEVKWTVPAYEIPISMLLKMENKDQNGWTANRWADERGERLFYSIGGQKCLIGMGYEGVAENQKIAFDLNQSYTSFSASIGADNRWGEQNGAVDIILDGTVIKSIKGIKAGEPLIDINMDVSTADTIEISVNGDHMVIGDGILKLKPAN